MIKLLYKFCKRIIETLFSRKVLERLSPTTALTSLDYKVGNLLTAPPLTPYALHLTPSLARLQTYKED